MPNYSLEKIVHKLGADSAAIMVPKESEEYMFCYDSFNMPQVWIDIKNPLDEKTSGGNVQVYRSGQSAITNHLKRTLKGHYIESVMVTPIVRNGKTIATLELIHDKNEKTFSETDLQVARKFADTLEMFIV